MTAALGAATSPATELKKDLEGLGAATTQVSAQASGSAVGTNSMTAAFGTAATGSLVLKNNLEGVALKLAGLRQAGLMARRVFAPVLNELNGEFLQTIGLSKETANAFDIAKSIAGGVAIGAMSGAAFGPWGAGIGAVVGGGSAAVAEWMKAHKAEAQNIEERRKLLTEAQKIGNNQVAALEATLRNYSNSQRETRAGRNLIVSSETSRVSQSLGFGNMVTDPSGLIGAPEKLLEQIEIEKGKAQRRIDSIDPNSTDPEAQDFAKENLKRIEELNKASAVAIQLANERRSITREEAQASLALFKSQQALELQALEDTYQDKSEKDEAYKEKRIQMMRDLHFEEAKLDSPDDHITNENNRAAELAAFTRSLNSDAQSADRRRRDPGIGRTSEINLGHLASIGGTIGGSVSSTTNTYYQRTATAAEKTLAKVEKIVANVEKIAQHSGEETVALAAA